MLPQIKKAVLVRDDMWMVWFESDAPASFHTVIRLIPAIDPPRTCPGGIWCKDFGCEEVYTNGR